MELIGKLKTDVEETKSKEEAKKVIKEAGFLLSDDELENVTGGVIRNVVVVPGPGYGPK